MAGSGREISKYRAFAVAVVPCILSAFFRFCIAFSPHRYSTHTAIVLPNILFAHMYYHSHSRIGAGR